jgi:hypothetical protein
MRRPIFSMTFAVSLATLAACADAGTDADLYSDSADSVQLDTSLLAGEEYVLNVYPAPAPACTATAVENALRSYAGSQPGFLAGGGWGGIPTGGCSAPKSSAALGQKYITCQYSLKKQDSWGRYDYNELVFYYCQSRVARRLGGRLEGTISGDTELVNLTLDRWSAAASKQDCDAYWWNSLAYAAVTRDGRFMGRASFDSPCNTRLVRVDDSVVISSPLPHGAPGYRVAIFQQDRVVPAVDGFAVTTPADMAFP